ncbi:hypothetical protein PPYR_00169 [Photinus pyralis]|uniref:Hydroxymethylglutaryl-CoA synthase n=1 Tax=Photinus pyralis TaxID=7054 RepID=A0A5N4B0S3_PHOPY|nr:hydroxymethylglutaryl-CoA synthase 1-like [Photinus pyralis]KAB0803199.1 hypothetical protein PPYR_00169 [Photinus pyralis]
MGSWPEDVGILAIETVFPSLYVDQTELEQYDGVSAGKYTVGLGQHKMGICGDREDINSICLTVVQNLMEHYDIKYTDIGRLEVGTETIIDKSKSVKSVLMQLFEPHGVMDIEGIDTTNACYGGTAALFNAIAWVESSDWNHRYALVVTADIAVYAEGPARPTGGAGAVAMLIGPNAPLVFDRHVRATYMRHVYDFYKPDLASEFPKVDGKLSIECYLNALDTCYQLYCKRASKRDSKETPVDLNHFDYLLFHTPFCKLMQKSVGRLGLNDFLSTSPGLIPQLYPGLNNYRKVDLNNSYFDKDVEKTFMTTTKGSFETKTQPTLLLANQIGNMYTASLYGGLVSLLINQNIEQIAGSKIGLFSYGSGLASTMYSITVTKDSNDNSQLYKLISNLKNVKTKLEQRLKISPEKFMTMLAVRQQNYNKAPFKPIGRVEDLFPGTYYLVEIDEMYRRHYRRHITSSNGSV